jgi:hypothetical protein
MLFLISASWVAKVTGVSHWHQVCSATFEVYIIHLPLGSWKNLLFALGFGSLLASPLRPVQGCPGHRPERKSSQELFISPYLEKVPKLDHQNHLSSILQTLCFWSQNLSTFVILMNLLPSVHSAWIFYHYDNLKQVNLQRKEVYSVHSSGGLSAWHQHLTLMGASQWRVSQCASVCKERSPTQSRSQTDWEVDRPSCEN